MSAHTQFNLRISTVNKSLFSGMVVSVTVPGSEGQMTVLAQHEPFVTLLRKGTIVIKTDDDSAPTSIQVDGGVLETSAKQMTVLI